MSIMKRKNMTVFMVECGVDREAVAEKTDK